MQILVINSGSSSIKFSFFDAEAVEPRANPMLRANPMPRALFEGEVSGIGGSSAKVKFADAEGNDLAGSAAKHPVGSIADAVAIVEELVNGPQMPKVEAIGYRVVHPGPTLKDHVRITGEVMGQLKEASAFAPLHDPTAVTIIEEMQIRFAEAAHFACFDTVFHETMPDAATRYPLPDEYAAKGVRRYGFHGLACESVVWQMRKAGVSFPKRMVIAHLGSGCSMTALVEGKSVDTSMGLTPTGGVVMGTRPGDLDPGLMLWLVRQSSADAVETMLNHHAGLAGLAGTGDMRAVRKAELAGDVRAALALKVFTRSVRKAMGSYLALLGGLDAVVFSGGIGEHDPASRKEILAGMEGLGIVLSDDRQNGTEGGMREISAAGSQVPVYVVPAEEDLMIARHVARWLWRKD